MDNETNQFHPADRVRITLDTGRFCDDRPDQTFLDGTRGSIGVIVSYEDFRADYLSQRRLAPAGLSDKQMVYLAGIERSIEEQYLLPIRFESVQPSQDADAVVCCWVGEIRLIHRLHYGLIGATQVFEKIE